MELEGREGGKEEGRDGERKMACRQADVSTAPSALNSSAALGGLGKEEKTTLELRSLI